MQDLAGRTPTGDDRAKTLLLKKAQLEAEQEAWTPIDVSRAPLFRMRLLRLGADDHVLLLILHHIIVDGWSIGIFMEELSELYAAFAAGRQAHLPAPALQFSDFARWQRRWSTSEAATQQFAYWKRHLRDASSRISPQRTNLESALLCSRIAHEPVRMSKELWLRACAR